MDAELPMTRNKLSRHNATIQMLDGTVLKCLIQLHEIHYSPKRPYFGGLANASGARDPISAGQRVRVDLDDGRSGYAEIRGSKGKTTVYPSSDGSVSLTLSFAEPPR